MSFYARFHIGKSVKCGSFDLKNESENHESARKFGNAKKKEGRLRESVKRNNWKIIKQTLWGIRYKSKAERVHKQENFKNGRLNWAKTSRWAVRRKKGKKTNKQGFIESTWINLRKNRESFLLITYAFFTK